MPWLLRSWLHADPNIGLLNQSLSFGFSMHAAKCHFKIGMKELSYEETTGLQDMCTNIFN